jgi:hypothetical protein
MRFPNPGGRFARHLKGIGGQGQRLSYDRPLNPE